MMTEKRFQWVYIKDNTLELRDNGIVKVFNNERFEEFLNDLSEENEQLKQQIGNLEHTRDFCAECCERLEKENEGLKFEIRKVQRAYEQLWEHTYK